MLGRANQSSWPHATATLGPVQLAPPLPTGVETDFLGTFGESWFRSVALVAGCEPATGHPDVSGADFLLTDPRTSEVIRVQVKTTEHPERTASGYRFDLDVSTHNKLSAGATHGYLALVVVHQLHPHWTAHLRGSSVVQASCFLSESLGPPSGNKSTVGVSLPISRLLSPGLLLRAFPDSGGES